ncbi:MAG TPA: DUF2243 domain-containing protein [Thermoanaerobaculia bacterium]|jgi:uncharacterized membrane protein
MAHTRFPLAPGFLSGVAMIGFWDGIVFHQILQWHHMICIETHCRVKTVAMLMRQNFYDGLFHLAMWITLVIGLVLLTRALQRGARFTAVRFWGSVLLGGGIFNVLEGIVDHHILEIHHVRFGPTQTIWDGSFLLLGALLAIAGWMLVRRDEPASALE